MRRILPVCLAVFSTIVCTIALSSTNWGYAVESFSASDLQAFAKIDPIDTHAHVFKVDAGFVDFLNNLHLHLLDIVVANKEDSAEFPSVASKITAAREFVQSSNARAALCTTFDPFKFTDATFADDAIRQLNEDFAKGAVAVKIWKNVGMEVKDESGRFVMPDDPRLQSIYRDIAAHGKTLIAHLAEPDSCWHAPNPDSPDYRYYNEHPEWYMFRHPDHPSKATIIQARDHMLEQNPQLRVVGAHLGSLESNLDELGRRLDRYPNFAVDVAARTVYLTRQPRDRARQFLIKYQNRILYGTDLGLSARGDAAAAEKSWTQQYATDWAYFSSQKTLIYRGKTVQGLALPAAVLRNLYHDNAIHWIPGVVGETSK